MNAIEAAWANVQKDFGEQIEVLGKERALILWIRGGEVAIEQHKRSLDETHAEFTALGAKMIRALKKKKPR